MHSVLLNIPWLPLQNKSAKLRKPKGQNRSQGMSLDVQTALFQGKDLLDGCILKLCFPFVFHKSWAILTQWTHPYTFF